MKTLDRSRRAACLALLSLALSCGGDDDSTAPSLDSASPPEAEARGGATITLSGHGLSTATAVRFAGVSASLVSKSERAIEVVAPAGLAGETRVEVDTEGGRATLDHGFAYTPIPLRYFDVASLSPGLAPAHGRAAVLVDMDGDGDLDLVQAAGREGVRVAWNVGGGRFDDVSIATLPDGAEAGDVRAVVPADFDGDGAVDLFFGAADAAAPALYVQSGAGTFADRSATGLPEGLGPLRFAAGVDLEGDGDVDLVIGLAPLAPEDTPSIGLLENDGGGRFTDATEATLGDGQLGSAGVAAADADGDGDLDLVFSVDGAPPRLYLGDGLGHFKRAAPDALPDLPIVGPGAPLFFDLDGDGALDLYLPSAGQDRAYRSDGRGRFFDRTDEALGPEAGAGVAAMAADLDRDGAVDVVVASASGRLQLYRNDGVGRLFDYSGELTGDMAALPSNGVAVGDVDGDGDLDLVASRGGAAAPSLFALWGPGAPIDGDGDGVPDDVDVCPDDVDPKQENQDAHPFACRSASVCLAETGCDLEVEGERAYLFCRTAPLSWEAAWAFCEGRGAALGLPRSADETAFLVAAGLDQAWIGASDRATEGAFVDVDGRPIGYSAWAAGEPNDGGGAEDCAVVLADGTRNDADCAGARVFYCEDARAKAPDAGDACDGCPLDADLQEGGAGGGPSCQGGQGGGA
jgi:hypothetical protein